MRFKLAAVAGLTIFAGGMAGTLVTAMSSGVHQASYVCGPFIGFFTMAAIGLAWRAAVHPGLDARTRSSWRWIGASFVLLTAAVVLFNVIPMTTFPRPGDLAKMAFAPVLLIGLTRLPQHRLSREHRTRLLLDAGTVAAAAGLFLWFLLVAPALTSGRTTTDRLLAAVAYPLENVGVVFVVAVVLMRGVNSSVRRSMLLLVGATVLWIIGDTMVSARYVDPTQPVTVGWEILVHYLAHFLLCVATFEQVRLASTGVDRQRRATRVTPVTKLPYAAVAAAFVVLAVAAAQPRFRLPWLGLIFCMAVLSGCVVARQLLAQRENLRMAVTDGLTGLANRVGLHEALELALARAARSGDTTAVLLADLDGFKHINDTLGHEAGDRVLAAFGDALRRSVRPGDVVGRLGGDEFAVVLTGVRDPRDADAVVERLHRELTEPVVTGDDVVELRASVGVALAPPGEMSLELLIRQADLDMYEVKRSRKDRRTAVR